MKRIFQFIIIITFSSSLMNCSSSTDDPTEKTAEEIQIEKLAKTWSLGTVRYGGDDVTDRFSGFTLTFTKSKTYSSTPDRGSYDFEPFESSGSWDFKENNLNLIHRNDGVDMDIIVSENTLKMNFIITESNGRLAGLGEYQFDLIVQ